MRRVRRPVRWLPQALTAEFVCGAMDRPESHSHSQLLRSRRLHWDSPLCQELLARIYLAGRAETVAFGLLCETAVCSENDIVSQRRALRDRSNLIFGSAHPQGGNTMSDDPGRGVVDSRFRVHGLTGLSVIDASILPTNLFANCQATVMALGWVAADEIMAGHQ